MLAADRSCACAVWKCDAQAPVLSSVHSFSLLRVGCCGWLGPADGPGYDERADQDATTDEHREGADHANGSLVVVQLVVRRHNACRASMPMQLSE